MFGGKKKLYAEGAQTEGLVVGAAPSKDPGWYWYTVRVKLPDGSTTEIRASNDGFALDVGDIVPVRYDPSNHSKVVLDVPLLKMRYKQAEAAQQAQFDAQLAHMGEPGSPAPGGPAAQALAGLGDLGDLKAQILQMAEQSPGSVIDLRSSQPPAEQASDPLDRLAKLADLKQQGVLTDAEFTAAKVKILGEG
ncbi:MAG TPA: SHOCT domain-containing protein [Solirubrobacteraceae bacterium]|nr:SHOCT domain-containing protein [Solirubrobacteraceae bacterium]